MISNAQYQFPTRKHNGQAERKSEITPVPTVFISVHRHLFRYGNISEIMTEWAIGCLVIFYKCIVNLIICLVIHK